MLYGSRGTFIALLTVFNSIFAPLFSSAVADVTCFRDVFYHASNVTVQYSYDVCESFYGSTIFQTCLRTTPRAVPLAFTPSFNYSNLCTSRILTLYVPVFIQSQLINTFTGPLVDVVLALLFHFSPSVLKDTLRGVTPPFFLSRNDRELLCLQEMKQKTKKEQEAELDFQENKLRIAAAGVTLARIPVFWSKKKERVPDTAEQAERKRLDAIVNRKAKFFNADKVLVAATNGLIVIMTFGCVAPLLTFVMTFSMCLQSLYLEFQVSTLVTSERAAAAKESTAKEDGKVHRLPPLTLRCMETLIELRRDQLALGGVICIVLLPCICVLSSLYSVFEQPAGWVTTYAFIRGTTPSVIMLVVWNAILLYFRRLLAFDDIEPESAPSGADGCSSTGAAAFTSSTEEAFDFDASEDFLGIGALEKDAAAMNDHGIQDIEWAVHLFSGIFLGVFLWDSGSSSVGIPMILFPTLVTIGLSLRALGQKDG
jgi:hypothetical protein